jgi:hypothetical protein
MARTKAFRLGLHVEFQEASLPFDEPPLELPSSIDLRVLRRINSASYQSEHNRLGVGGRRQAMQLHVDGV